MRAWLGRNRGYVATFIASVGAVGLLQWWAARPPGAEIQIIEPTAAPTATVAPTATPSPMAVFVSGEVARPGVYYLPPGSRVVDAIGAAGGFAPAADRVVVNLAEPVGDGMHVHVPVKGTAPTPPPVVAADPGVAAARSDERRPADSRLVNINTASLDELDQLPGIGPAIAQRIIDYRTANGPFQSIDEIKQVSGVGEKLFEKIKDLITVGYG